MIRPVPVSDDELRAEALATLRGALEDPVLEVRREAALALTLLADVESTVALTRALSDEEPVRRAATLALGRIEAAEATTALLNVLESDATAWREAAVALSRHHHDPTVTERLTQLLSNRETDEHVRRGAALALGALLAKEPLSMEAPVLPTYADEHGRLHILA
jgi:HEAT repeat protein